MNLLAPAGLFALLLLPVIIAMHMWRVRHRRHTLSSTLLWSRVLSETPLRRPLRLPIRFLLLALQLAVLACGALALARPAWVVAGAGHRVLVVVDTSLAMSATDVAPTRLAGAETAVRPLIDSLRFGDSMTIVDAGATPRVLITSSDHAALLRALRQLAPGAGPPATAETATLLGGLVATDPRHTTAYLFTPLGTPRAALAALSQAAPGLRVRLIGLTTADRGVAGLTVACVKALCEAYARLVNSGRSAFTAHVSIVVDGTASSQTVVLPAVSVVPVRLTLPASAHTVELRLDGHDALPADDAAWAVAPLPIHRRVLLVTYDGTTALAQALRAIPNLSVTTTTPDSYSDDMTRQVDLTVLDTPAPDLQPPGSLLIVNPNGGDVYFNKTGTITAPGVVSVDSTSPLLRAVDLSSLVIASATRAQLPAWAHSDIQSAAGPLLFDGVTGGQRIAVLLFDPRPAATDNASNLATLLAFPTLLQNAMQALAPQPPATTPAGTVTSAAVTRQGTVWLHAMTGPAVALPSSGDLATLPALRPGLYALSGGASGALAANATPPGDPSAAPDNATPAQAPPVPALVLPPLNALWEGWAAICLLAMLILSAEWWYYARHT